MTKLLIAEKPLPLINFFFGSSKLFYYFISFFAFLALLVYFPCVCFQSFFRIFFSRLRESGGAFKSLFNEDFKLGGSCCGKLLTVGGLESLLETTCFFWASLLSCNFPVKMFASLLLVPHEEIFSCAL